MGAWGSETFSWYLFANYQPHLVKRYQQKTTETESISPTAFVSSADRLSPKLFHPDNRPLFSYYQLRRAGTLSYTKTYI